MHIALTLLPQFGFDPDGSESVAVRAAQVVGAHHGRCQLDEHGAGSRYRVDAVMGGEAWRRLRHLYVEQLRHQAGMDIALARFPVAAAALVAGVVVVADRAA